MDPHYTSLLVLVFASIPGHCKQILFSSSSSPCIAFHPLFGGAVIEVKSAVTKKGFRFLLVILQGLGLVLTTATEHWS